jgi:hypothetical protein
VDTEWAQIWTDLSHQPDRMTAPCTHGHIATSDRGALLIALNNVHEDARRRFDELADELRAAVTTFREPPKSDPPGFSPPVHMGPSLTEENLVGEPVIHYRDAVGARVGVARAEVGGTRKGLIGAGYEKFLRLVSAVARTRPFSTAASTSFLEDRIFEWATGPAQQSEAAFTDYVFEELQKAAGDHRILIPITDLFVALPLEFGRVTITEFPEQILRDLENRQVAEHSREQHAAFCHKLRVDFQGAAVGEVTVAAEPLRAMQLAIDEIELVVGIIRFFAPANVDQTVVSRIARWGYAPQRVNALFTVDESGRFRAYSSSLIDRPGRAIIDHETWNVLEDAGFADVRAVLLRKQRTELENAVLAGMNTFGRAALTGDLRERLVWYCAGLESVLLKNPSEPVLLNLSERLAMLAYTSADERAAAVTHVREAYSLRSGFVHHGLDVLDREVVERFARHGIRLFLRLVRTVNRFGSKTELLDHLDRMKLLGNENSEP